MTDREHGIHTYVIYGIYDKFSIDAFGQYLKDSIDILSYWNHMPLLYFVKTRLDVTTLTEKVKPFFGGSWLIVVKVVPEDVNGWMPLDAWPWFKTPSPTQKVPTSGGMLPDLASLFLPKS